MLMTSYKRRQYIYITLEQTASSVLYKLGQTSLNFALTESTDALSPR